MPFMPDHIRPDDWLCTLFSARAAAQGGVVRRKTRDIERIVGMDRYLAELGRRGVRAVQNASQPVVFCSREEVRVLR